MMDRFYLLLGPIGIPLQLSAALMSVGVTPDVTVTLRFRTLAGSGLKGQCYWITC